jgi:hypothetical protein
LVRALALLEDVVNSVKSLLRRRRIPTTFKNGCHREALLPHSPPVVLARDHRLRG